MKHEFPARTRTVHFLGKRNSIPNVELFPNRVLSELSRIAFPTIVLLKDDRTDSFQEERLALPYWTMILAICVVVDVAKHLDILTLELSTVLMRLPL